MDEVEKYFYTLGDNEKLKKKKFSWKNFIFGTLAFALIASLLRIGSFSLPFISGITKVDFSVPIVMLCFFLLGPWSALIVMIIENLVHFFIDDPKLISVAFDVFVTSVMILVCYYIIVFYKTNNKIKQTIIAGLLATAIVGVSVCVFDYFIYYPVMNNYYNMTSQTIVEVYHRHFSYIDSTIKCILLFDAPWFASGILFGTIISAIAIKIKSALE